MNNPRIEMLESFLKEDPNDSFSRYALALEYDKQEDNSKAIELLEELRSMNPEYLALYYQLGKLYEKGQQQETALHIYKSGIDLAKAQKNRHTLAELQQALSEISNDDF